MTLSLSRWALTAPSRFCSQSGSFLLQDSPVRFKALQEASGPALLGKSVLPLIGPGGSPGLCLPEPIAAAGEGASGESQTPELQQTPTRLSGRSCSGSGSPGLRELRLLPLPPPRGGDPHLSSNPCQSPLSPPPAQLCLPPSGPAVRLVGRPLGQAASLPVTSLWSRMANFAS